MRFYKLLVKYLKENLAKETIRWFYGGRRGWRHPGDHISKWKREVEERKRM